jgi:hypothetical protein
MGGILKRNSVVTAIRRSTTKSKTARRPETQPEQQPCAICQEPVGVPSPDGITEGWSTLSCGHTFGSVCIKKWLGMIERPACPMCREEIAHSCGHAVLPVVVVDAEPEALHRQAQKRWSVAGDQKRKHRASMSRDDPRRSECGFCSMSPHMRMRLRTRIIIKMIRIVLKGTRQRRYVQSMDNWQRAQVVIRQQEVREEWEDWWDLQEPRTDRERETPSSAGTSETTLPQAGTTATEIEVEVGEARPVAGSLTIETISMAASAGSNRPGRAASL